MAEAFLFTDEVMKHAPYGTVYADPPWPCRTVVRTGKTAMRADGGKSWMRYATDPYHTMAEAEILEMPVEAVAADGAILVLWCPWAHLDLGMRTIRAWGFKYASGMPWLKVTKAGVPHFGLGMWFRQCSEALLIARRGKIRWPSGFSHPSPARPGLVVTMRGAHSEKPEEVADWIEEKMPGPYLELFARRRRKGWVCWGDEIDKSQEGRR